MTQLFLVVNKTAMRLLNALSILLVVQTNHFRNPPD